MVKKVGTTEQRKLSFSSPFQALCCLPSCSLHQSTFDTRFHYLLFQKKEEKISEKFDFFSLNFENLQVNFCGIFANIKLEFYTYGVFYWPFVRYAMIAISNDMKTCGLFD